jgi:predicted metalloprotease
MRYNPRARLDRSQVEDRRGSGGGGGFPMGGGGGGIKVGGGIGGVILLVIIFLLQSQLGGGSDSGGSGGSGQAQGSGSLDQCRSGAVANQDPDCALVADVNSIQSFWADDLPREAGVDYTAARTTLFTGATSTGCGSASSDVGPFYCPVDKHVYLDPTFFKDMLEGQLGAKGGPFSQAYVLAHEYGHHVQNLLGTSNRVKEGSGATSDSVRLELQADCYAGVWANHATTAPSSKGGKPLIRNVTDDDIARALDTAAKIGDDYIQKELGGGQVDPSQFTHGTSAQREKWFRTGLQSGNPNSCNTFDTSNLG